MDKLSNALRSVAFRRCGGMPRYPARARRRPRHSVALRDGGCTASAILLATHLSRGLLQHAAAAVPIIDKPLLGDHPAQLLRQILLEPKAA